MGEVGPDPVHFIHKGDFGHAVLVGLAPDGFRLGLDPTHGAEHADRTVQHPQRAFHLDGKIHVAGGVDELDVGFVPLAGGDRRGDRDAAFLFVGHPVHYRLPVVDLADFMGFAGVVEDAFGNGGFAGINMGNDADVADGIDFRCSLHSGLHPRGTGCVRNGRQFV